MSEQMPTGSCQLVKLRTKRLVEVTAFNASRAVGDSLGLPHRPGAVSVSADGVSSLYFAPGRWLLVEPTAAWETRVREATQWGTWVEVTGKWSALTLQGPGAERLLASTIDVQTTLYDRECAAVTLFDCPSILVRGELGFTIWVRASVVEDWVAAVERLGASWRIATP